MIEVRNVVLLKDSDESAERHYELTGSRLRNERAVDWLERPLSHQLSTTPRECPPPP